MANPFIKWVGNPNNIMTKFSFFLYGRKFDNIEGPFASQIHLFVIWLYYL